MAASSTPLRVLSRPVDTLLRAGIILCPLILILMRGAGINVMLRLPVLAASIIAAVIWIFRSSQVLRPAAVISLVWAIGFSGFYSGALTTLIDWPLLAPHAFLVLAVMLVIAGSHWYDKMARPEPARSSAGLNRIAIDFFALCGFISTAFFLYEMMVLNSVDLSDTTATRAAFQMKEATLFTYVALLTRPGAVIALFAALVYWERIALIRRVFYVSSGVVLALQGVASAGRFVILLIVMTTVYAFGIRRSRGQAMLPGILTKVAAGGLLCVLAGYVFYISQTRSVGSYESAPYRYYLISSRLEIDPDLMRAGFEELPIAVRTAIVTSYTYLALPIGHFAVFWDVYQGDPVWGALQYPLLARNLARLQIPVALPNEVLEERFQEFFSYGEPGYTWQTAIRDCVVDFGHWGTLLVAFGFGVILQHSYRKAAGDDLGNLVVGLTWWMIAFHSTMYSIAGEPTIFMLLLSGYGLKAMNSRIFHRKGGSEVWTPPAQSGLDTASLRP